MSDEIDRVVEAACRMPLTFKTRSDLSILQVFHASGYAAWAPEVTEALILAHLRSRPDLIDAWLAYSEDQRCSPAWYLTKDRDEAKAQERWVVGYYDGGRTQEETFQDGYRAAAHYIKRFLDGLWGR